MDLFPQLSNNYYALTFIPIGILLISSVVVYKLGLRIPSSIGLGLLLSLISIIILHQYHFKDDQLIKEETNLYVSIYIFTSIILLLIIMCYLILKNPNNNCFCCEKCREKGPEYLYNRDRVENSADVNGYNSPEIENYKDVLEHSSDDIHPGVKEFHNSGFIGSFKNKSPLDGLTIKDEEWNKEIVKIEIGEVEGTGGTVNSSVVPEDDGLIYEYHPPKIFDNSEDE